MDAQSISSKGPKPIQIRLVESDDGRIDSQRIYMNNVDTSFIMDKERNMKEIKVRKKSYGDYKCINTE